MSGPKVSVYEMSAKQRKNLRAQLYCLQQSLVCREEIQQSVRYLNGMNGQIQSLLSTFELANRRTNHCSLEIGILTDYQEILPQFCQLLLEELAQISIFQVDRFTLTEAELAKRQEALAKLQVLQNKAAAKYKEIQEALAPMGDQAKQDVENVKNAIADDVAGVHSFLVLAQETEEEKLKRDKKRVKEQLRALTLETDCSPELKSKICSVCEALSRLHSEEQLKTFEAVTIRPLQSRVEAATVKKQEEEQEYKQLWTRLAALGSVALVTQNDMPPAKSNLEQLKISIARLEKQIVTQTEQAYISDCVNDVMSEMGYDMIGNRSVKKRSGKRFNNELYTYGDGTAINVTYDSEGQIALELGGIDRNDRIPTEEETEVLQEDMESFCSDFKRFEERLESKGITMKSRVSMAPPSAEYAAIINLSDYTITSATPIQEIDVSKKRTTATAKHTMQKESD